MVTGSRQIVNKKIQCRLPVINHGGECVKSHNFNNVTEKIRFFNITEKFYRASRTVLKCLCRRRRDQSCAILVAMVAMGGDGGGCAAGITRRRISEERIRTLVLVSLLCGSRRTTSIHSAEE